jgi:DNA uptake protein ComE-like DNA-binding protein
VTIEKQDFKKFEKQMDSLNAYMKMDSFNQQNSDAANFKERKEDVSEKKAERFNFDPNDLSEADWQKLGLSEKQIRTIKNYESKGGKFRKKEDLKKMYCIKKELYISLEPYIQITAPTAFFENGQVKTIENSSGTQSVKKIASVVKSDITATIELNSADSAMLTTIKGIGAFYAKTIIKYRNSLGGFHTKEQLLEVWKFDLEKYNNIEKYISVDASKVKKTNINTCASDQLKGPYINWTVANAIVNYRKQHGSFKTIDDIQKTDLVDDETLRKIAPYLIIE